MFAQKRHVLQLRRPELHQRLEVYEASPGASTLSAFQIVAGYHSIVKSGGRSAYSFSATKQTVLAKTNY